MTELVGVTGHVGATASGGPRRPLIRLRTPANTLRGSAAAGHLEDGVAPMAHEPGAGLDQAFTQAGQRPGLDHLRRRQRPREVGEIVGQGVKLKPDSVGRELHAG